MKSRYWLILISGLLAVCAAMSAWLFWPSKATQAQIVSDGVVIATVDLHKDQQFTIQGYNGGENVVTVKDGKIAVTEASCPDHYCMQRGFCNSGTAIVCLPNRMVIKFLADEEIDSVVG